MGAPPGETKAECHRDFNVSRASTYNVWVRYYDHLKQTEPFRVSITQPQQGGTTAISAEMGVLPVVPPNDEYQLYWGFSFGWAHATGELQAGPATLSLSIERPGEQWRQVDAVMLTDDLDYRPVHREKPPFAYNNSFELQPQDGGGAVWRGAFAAAQVGAATWSRPAVGGKDFSMWTNINYNASWWRNSTSGVSTMSLYDMFFAQAAPADIKDAFHSDYAGRKDVPVMSWPGMLPGLYLATPDLSPGSPLLAFLVRTKTPFFILTNYATPNYNATTGPQNYAALKKMAGQFLGYIHGEAVGPGDTGFGPRPPEKPLPGPAAGVSRRQYVDAAAKWMLANEAKVWGTMYKTPVPETYWSKGISALSVDATALCHLFLDMGASMLAYEEDSVMTNVHMRIAFMRGAARQYQATFMNYASSNFGDGCSIFTQEPSVPRGAKDWYANKYAITDGPSTTWYRKLYYLNYMSGASAVFWEEGVGSQFMKPGPGTHPVGLSPLGRATEEFQAFVDRLPDRGEPYTPVAILLSYGHGYERSSFSCKMLDKYTEDKNDLEIRELFNVLWWPTGAAEALKVTDRTLYLILRLSSGDHSQCTHQTDCEESVILLE